MTHATIPMNVLVLVNSMSSGYREGAERVLPHLDHLGVPHALVDLAHAPLPPDVTRYALVIVAHRRLDPRGRRLGGKGRRRLLAAVRAGTGLASFDPGLPSAAEAGAIRSPDAPIAAGSIGFPSEPHYITARHELGERLALVGPLRVPPLAAVEGGVLVTARGRPLLTVARLGQGRVVQWATTGWMHTRILGPLAGLDDVLWRGLVWAARKPFTLRGLGPLVSMRVDDVAGRGGLWGQSALHWVQAANRSGFKPWLGLFIYNLTQPAVNELRDFIRHGQATAFPHAFGRPPRSAESDFPWYEQALPWRADDYDEFIYFDHQRGREWSAEEAARGLAAVDEWYAGQGPLPVSTYAVPHWYEMGHNVVAHIHERWGAEFVGQPNDVGTRFAAGTRWLRLGPFRRHEAPRSCYLAASGSGRRPVYYADWVNFCGHRFFNCLTEVRDDAGYEWQPDNDGGASVGRGLRQLRRALDSMALPVLFTHETDYVCRISPENWAAEIAQIARGLDSYAPIYVTLDEALRYVRATRTSRLESACYDAGSGTVSASFSGHADVATHFYLFTEVAGEIEERLVDVPAFEGEQVVAIGARRPASRGN